MIDYTREHDVPEHPLYAPATPASAAIPARAPWSPAKMSAPAAGGGSTDAAKECGLHFSADGKSGAHGGRAAARSAVLRNRSMTHKGFTLWFTGMSGAGKSTSPNVSMARLREAGAKVELLDGDIVRTNLSQGPRLQPGGSRHQHPPHRLRQRIAVAQRRDRDRRGHLALSRSARRGEERGSRTSSKSIVDCPIEVLAERDVKGLYKRALAGEIGNFTGVSDPYEPPLDPDVVIHSDRETSSESVDEIWRKLKRRGLISGLMIDLHTHTDRFGRHLHAR